MHAAVEAAKVCGILARKWRIGLLGGVVSALALLLVFSQFDANEFLRALLGARWVYALACAGLLLLALLPRALRWRTLLAGALPYWRVFHIMNIAYLVNNVLPLRIGEVARLYLATQATPPVPVFKTLSTVVVERLLDLLAVVVLLGFALAAGDVPAELRAAGASGAFLALSGFLLLVFFASRRGLSARIIGFFTARWPLFKPLERWLAQFLDGLTPITRPQTLAQVLLWTALGWGISVLAGYTLMLAFYERSDHLAVTCLYIASAAFAIAVPAVPGNLGTYEASIVLALGAFAYAQNYSVAVAFAIVVHGVNLLVHCAAGLYGFIQEGVSLERLSQGVQEIRQHTNHV